MKENDSARSPAPGADQGSRSRSNAARGSAGYYVKLSRAAMACHFEILLHPEDRVCLRT